MSRMDDLALAAAEAFDDLRSPFDTAWLVEHLVTADECSYLSWRIAEAIRAFQEADPMERAISATKRNMVKAGEPALAAAFEQHARAGQALKKLRGRS